MKNLPTYITEPRLRDHFSATAAAKGNVKGGGGGWGDLTDVRIVHKKDGSSRRIAFLGFKTEEEAQRAREYFDKTYLDVSRLRVETVTGTKDAPIHVKDKRTREKEDNGDEGRNPKRRKVDAGAQTSAVDELDPKKKRKAERLEEFTRVMGSKRNAGPSWTADNQLQPELAVPVKTAKTQKKESKMPEKKAEEKMEEDMDGAQEELSDMEWLRRKMQASTTALEDKAFEQSDEEMEEKKEEEQVSPVDANRAAIETNGRLFVRNLVFSCTQDELTAHFSPFGPIEQVHIPVDAESNPKGFAYVRFKDASHAVAAYEALDKTSFQGRLLHILPAIDRVPRTENSNASNNPMKLKAMREQKRKENSGKDFNWAILYMNSDAVANSIADRLGIAKSDILNPDSEVGGSPAVKLALAETHIIAETKKYLEQHNVDLSLFSQHRIPRSKTIILVKNIPYGTSSSELHEMFSTFGSLKQVLMPPAGTIAIVQFPDDAGKQAGDAWRGLAYKRLKDSILYLEWAPQGLFDGPPPDSKKPAEESIDQDIKEDEELAAPGATLHVGNLSFATTSTRLASIFRHLPSFAFAKVATKADPSKPGQVLSQGFGFVGFKDVEAARKAMKGFNRQANGTGSLVLDGHVLKISFAGRGREDVERDAGGILGKHSKSKGTKLIVKNLAFEVSKKELWELFSAHGQVKSVRLPNRADRRSRGFAFVDFATRNEAENAMGQLRHSHLLGRHLVLEWAEREQDVEEMRYKTKMEYGDGAGNSGRKEKLRLGLGGVGSDEEE